MTRNLTIPPDQLFDGTVPAEAADIVLAQLEAAEETGLSEWQKARLGKITGSNFGRITRGRGDKGWSQGTETFMNEIIGEWMTGQPANEFTSVATDWGIEYEDEAIQIYEQKTRRKVVRGKFYKAEQFQLVGCTPDGVGRNYGLEVKCPITPKNHIRAMETGEVPEEYRDQVNGHMLVTGKKKCAFVSYHPLMKRPEWKMVVIDVDRNRMAMDELEERLFEFEACLIRRLDHLGIDWRNPNYFDL